MAGAEANGIEAATLIASARELTPLLAEHAAASERARRPADAVIAALRDAGVFRLMVPRSLGGLELDLDTFLEVGLALAEGDASMAWVSTFYIEHNWMLCQFPDPVPDEILGERGEVLAPAVIAPDGRAERTEGGLRLSGRWSFATGSAHAEYVILSGMVDREGDASGPPDLRFFALPRDQVTIEDVWFMDGMAATASNDVVVDEVLVPEARTVSILDMVGGRAPGAVRHAGPLYRTPMLPILCLAASMPAVGQARAAVNGFLERMRERILYGTGTRQSERPAAQIRLARAEIEARQAESLLRDVTREVMELRGAATIEDRARWSASTAMAVDLSKRVLRSVADASGAKAHHQDHPLQRAVRDVNALSGHVVFDLDARLEIHGRAMLGLDPGGMV